jgi:DNA-binding MarR family transcriptional regulator
MEKNRTVGEHLDYTLVAGVLDVHGALQQTIADLMRELELTEPLADAIWQLGPGEPPLSRRELADRLHCDPSNVTFLVDRLEEKGLAQRAVDQHDRRVKAVSLTPAGVAVRQQLVAGAAAAPIFAGLTKVQKQQLTQLLQACLAGAELSR